MNQEAPSVRKWVLHCKRNTMNLSDKIIGTLKSLPESKQVEVFDFIEYIKAKNESSEWSNLSLSSAMRGMENEISPYSLNDIKEAFS